MAKKPGKRGVIRGIGRTVFNPRLWMGYDTVKASGQEVSQLAKELTTIQKATRVETFEEAKIRLNLSEADIQSKMKSLFLSSCVYAGIAGVLIVYGLVSLVLAQFLACIITIVLGLLALSLSFRDSFFYYQMKQRRLGCSVKEWIGFITRRG